MARVAVQAASGPAPAAASGVLQRKCACGQSAGAHEECEDCKKKRFQRKPARPGAITGIPRSAEATVRTPGAPLDRPTRELMETRFAHDFSRVRVHADGDAAAAAKAVDAQAFTIGQHVVFGSGRYAPSTTAGRRLLAHELTHVVQQQNGLRAESGSAADDAEREALRNEALFDLPAARLAFSARPAPLARKAGDTEVTVQAPAAAPGCTEDQHTKISPAAARAIEWLDRTIQQLSAFIAAPADRANAAVGEALQRHFRSREPAIAQRVLDRVTRVRHDVDAAREGVQLTTECHTTDDRECRSSNAYVTGDNNTLVFCPNFFEGDLDTRAESIVHEMMHTIGVSPDRAYGRDRLLPQLTTPEALTNAESYGYFVQQLGTGKVPVTGAPEDTFQRKCRDIEPLLRAAIARAQRWNRAGETRITFADPVTVRTHLGDDTPALRTAAFEFYNGVYEKLTQPFDFRCDKSCGNRLAFGETAEDNFNLGLGLGAGIGAGVGLIVGGIVGSVLGAVGAGIGLGLLAGLVLGGIIGMIVGGVTSHGPRIHVCPGWKDLGDESARIEWILRAAYEALGKSVADSAKYAKLAGVLYSQFFPIPTLQEIDRTMLQTRLDTVRARLVRLRALHAQASDEFAASVAQERLGESVRRGTADLHRRARADRADNELWGGHFAGDSIRRSVTVAGGGSNAVTLTANMQITYVSLSDKDGRARADQDIARMTDRIRTVWDTTITSGEYANVAFRLVPTITYLAPGAPRAQNAFLIQVRGPDKDPSSGDSPSGIISLALAHLDPARVIVVAHELAHLFGFTETYLTETRKEKGKTIERMTVGRSDPANRPDLLGLIDPVVLAREQGKGAVTAQDVARQTGKVRIWEEEATIALRTLGVDPPATPRPTPDSENFDPQVELGRVKREGEQRLDTIRRQRERIDNSMRSLDLAEQIIQLEAEERSLAAQLAPPAHP